MNKNTVIILLLSALIILTGAPTSFAKQEYLTNLTEVYGAGSCETCHNNGSAGGPRTSYGMLFENQTNHTANASAALIAIKAPPKSTATTPTAAITTTPIKVTPEITEETTEEDTQEDTQEDTESQEETFPVTTEEAKGSPGFGFIASLVGLFAWALLTKRNNK